jgi:hypothetical protein
LWCILKITKSIMKYNYIKVLSFTIFIIAGWFFLSPITTFAQCATVPNGISVDEFSVDKGETFTIGWSASMTTFEPDGGVNRVTASISSPGSPGYVPLTNPLREWHSTTWTGGGDQRVEGGSYTVDGGIQQDTEFTVNYTIVSDISCPGGKTLSKTITMRVNSPPVVCSISSFTADNYNPAYNTGTTLRFTLNGSYPWTIGLLQGGTDPSPTSGTGSGSASTGNLTSTHTYRLYCQSVTKDVTIVVPAPGDPLAYKCSSGSCIYVGSDPSATHSASNCNNSCGVATCQDTSANNYGGALPCTYNTPTVCSENSSVTIVQDLPSTMIKGQTYPFSIRVTNVDNISNTVWWHGGAYSFRKKSGNLTMITVPPTANNVLGLDYGHLPNAIQPPVVGWDNSVTWTFNVTPTVLGNDTLSMQMLHHAYWPFRDTVDEIASCPAYSNDQWFGAVGSKNYTVVNAPTPAPDLKVNADWPYTSGVKMDGPIEIVNNGWITISWGQVAGCTAPNTCTCTFDGSGVSATSGSVPRYAPNNIFPPTYSRTWTLTCTNSTGQSGSDSVTVSIPPPPLSYTATCSADGTIATLNWTLPAGYSGGYVRNIPAYVEPFEEDVLSGLTYDVPIVPNQVYTDIALHTRAPNEAWSTPVYLPHPPGNTSTPFSCPSATPTVNGVSISSPVVKADNSTQYDIKVVSSSLNGASSISNNYALINISGSNIGSYRGYLTWSAFGNIWSAQKNNTPCTYNGAVNNAGSYAAIQSVAPNDIYGHQYINLDSCDVSDFGNIRTTTFKVHFNDTFTTPITNNDIDGYSCSYVNGVQKCTAGWVNFNQNFSLMPPYELTASAPTPNTATVGSAQTFSSTITNSGFGVLPSSFSNFFQVASAANGGGTVTDKTSSSMSALAAGGTGVATVSHTFASAGTYSVRACADKTSSAGGGVITEQDETNNCGAWTNVTVSNPIPVPVTTITANPTSGTQGIVNPTLTWSATNSPTGCTASGDWSGSKAVSGTNVSQGVLNTVKTYTFTLFCSNATGNGTPVSATVVVSAANTAPNVPGITGPGGETINTSYTYNFTTTDSENNQVRVAIDWDNNGTEDEWLPTASTYVPSGTVQATSHTWTSNGAKTIKARAYDTLGAASGWATYNLTVSLAPITVTVNKVYGGTVTTVPACVNSGNTCVATIASGGSITLTATPNSPQWKFTGWSGTCPPAAAVCTLNNVVTSVTLSPSFALRPIIIEEF